MPCMANTLDLNFEANFTKQDGNFLPVMASNHTSMNYITDLFSRIIKFITCWPSAQAFKRADSGQGQNFTPYLSAHHLIGTYFLTTESDNYKRMCVLTSLYGITRLV